MPGTEENVLENVRTEEELSAMIDGTPEERAEAIAYLQGDASSNVNDAEAGSLDEILNVVGNDGVGSPQPQPGVSEPVVENLAGNPLNVEPPTGDEMAGNEEAGAGKFKFTFQNKEVEIDDSDGFLGRGSVDGLKKARAHQEQYVGHLESQNSDLSSQLTGKDQAIAKLEKLLAERVPTNTPVAPTQPTPQANQNAQPSEQAALSTTNSLGAMVRPKRPPVSENPSFWSAEDEEAMKSYHDKNEEYLRALDDVIKNGKGNDPRITELENTIKEVGGYVDNLKNAELEANRQAQENKAWAGIDDFRQQHKEYNTAGKSSRTLHQEVQDWMKRLVVSTGTILPYNANQEQINQFEKTKLDLANKYLQGDQALTSIGIEPPNGTQEYFKLGELNGKLEEFRTNGQLGTNATLHDAWLLSQDRSGSLDDSITAIEKDARQAGAQAVVGAMKNHQQNHAVNLPNSLPQKPDAGNDPTANLSQEQIKALFDMTPLELQQKPELAQLKQQIMSRI